MTTEICKCGHFLSDHSEDEGCLGCPCEVKYIKKITRKGYVAMNNGEFDDLQNMTFLNNLKEAKKWKGQEILEVEIRFKPSQKQRRKS